jgi:Helicase conserved C-terminal domain/SEC-C motif
MDRLAYQLSRIDARTTEALARLFLDGGKGREPLAQRLAQAIRDPAAVERGLGKLRPDALRALSVALDAGGLVPRALLIDEVSRALGATGPAALEALAASGLLMAVPNSDRIGVPETFAEALVWFVPSLEPVCEGLAAEPDPLRFDEAVVLALLASARPRVNRDGRVNATDLRKLEKRLASSPRLARRFDVLVEGLVDVHALRLGDRVELEPERTTRHLTAPLAEWQTALVARRLSSWPVFRIHALCAMAGARWVPSDSLLRVLRLRPFGWGEQKDHEGVLEKVAEALLLGQTTNSDGVRFFRAPQPPGPEAGKLIIQPSFEVLAPPDAPPHVIAQLGRFAELQHADRFATFRLSEAGMQAAIDEGATVDELLELLEAHAAHGVPQNVELTVRGWTKCSRRAVLCEGLAIQFDDAAQRVEALAALTKAAVATTELGDRVLVVPGWEGSRVKTLLRKLPMRVIDRDVRREGAEDDETGWVSGGGMFEDRSARRQIPKDASGLHARLAQRIAEGYDPVRAHSSPASPRSSSKLSMVVEAAAKSGAPLLIRAYDQARMVLVERLRERGGRTYAEVVAIDGDEAYSIPVDDIVEAQPVEARGPITTGEKVGRNQPCPCGSGKKYKRCCLAGQTPAGLQ